MRELAPEIFLMYNMVTNSIPPQRVGLHDFDNTSLLVRYCIFASKRTFKQRQNSYRTYGNFDRRCTDCLDSISFSSCPTPLFNSAPRTYVLIECYLATDVRTSCSDTRLGALALSDNRVTIS